MDRQTVFRVATTRTATTRVLTAGLCGLCLALAGCSGASSGGGADTGSTSHATPAGSASIDAGGGQTSSPPSASAASTQGGGGDAKTAPTSCDPLTPIVQRDLGVSVTKATAAQGQTPAGSPASVCELFGGTSTVIDVIYQVKDDAPQAVAAFQDAKSFAPHVQETPHDLTGIGDQAFYVSDSTGAFAWMAVATGNAVVYLKEVQGDVTLAKWQSLATDVVTAL